MITDDDATEAGESFAAMGVAAADAAAGTAAGELRRRLLEHKQARLAGVRARLTEQLSELCFLQGGGNMVDWPAWRARPPPSLRTFLDARPPGGAASPEREAVCAARHEAAVAARVAELARAGLWPERRLPRVLEPPRHKAHWDYLLEEAAWLAQDFALERKWKKQAAKKCARAVQKYFQDKALAAQKAEKAQEIQLKKIAAFAAKEIRTFWANVEKLVEWKRSRVEERARKEALDEQLSYIVDRSEQYSRQLAANLEDGGSDSPPSDYSGGEDSADDESTIAAAEKALPADHRAELAALAADAELSLDELRARYMAPAPGPPSPADSGAESGDESDSTVASRESAELAELVAEPCGERRVEAAAQLAASLQPLGTTISAAGTPSPALLRGTLREYQLVGLHWLVTMHSRELNGILADEMGLGKTIQTIALLAHLAHERHDWGPHLVVAPTSVMLNWEMEFKKWCPAFKILTYYGTIKERKLKRVGWTKANSFHICITSYKLVVQDHQSFRRKKWKYLILDEAQNIKNFKSQRWQLLLNFQTERRLLLTGTPLQNSLLELWSLMHFLMPSVFASHTEFREWFTPLAGAAGGEGDADPALLRRLHAVLRPFLLRRLKADVERQMPRKFEHVLLCRLARRQRALYDDFMARAATRDTLASGNLLAVINVLMQLRKVCNHPDLFEPRPVTSPLQMTALKLALPALLLKTGIQEKVLFGESIMGGLASLEVRGMAALAAHRARHLAPPRRCLEEPAPPPPPRPPPACLRLHLRTVARAPHPATAPARAPPPPLTLPLVTPMTNSTPNATTTAEPTPTSNAASRLASRRRAALRRAALINERRCWRLPLYGSDLRAAVEITPPPIPAPRLEEVVKNHESLITRVGVCSAAARACPVDAAAGAGAAMWRRRRAVVEEVVDGPLRDLLGLLRVPASVHAVAFPHPSLLQYDCGKLQTLATLLRRLRAGGHRVLIFTQMTRVLDVLEAFLSMHGHTYLRLDGATRLDRRQPLVDRFNADSRIFAFILSTRSGGVGLNLTGADTVVFYDSDWNPTMDAQAQDRCHRIGQTRDVHVYRLVTTATVEENILRKAEQKRALGHLAIEDGHFTTSYLRADTLAELLGAAPAQRSDSPAALERALAAAEDEADAAAARAARAEQARDLAEFDESVPLERDDDVAAPPADDLELAALMKQLRPVEKFAMRAVESWSSPISPPARPPPTNNNNNTARPLRRIPRARPPSPATYAGSDARAQVWISDVGKEEMPMWCPPTPPAGAGDVYRDVCAGVLYRAGAAAERLLPAARARVPPVVRARPPRAPPAPASLFERGGRGRQRVRPAPAPPSTDWAPHEDAALRRALRLQRLPPEPPPALLPNWEWCAELLADAARSYRPPRAARDRHAALADPERARRRQRKLARARRRPDEPPPPPLSRLESMREAAERRRSAPKRRYDEPPANGARHAALLAELGVEYDSPPTPLEVASRRADRIAKEKLKAGGATTATTTPARVVVAGGERRRDGATLLYRQQALARQQHLKILHHTPHPQTSGASTAGTAAAGAANVTTTTGGGGGGGGVLAARARAPQHHLVLAHLAPAPPPPAPRDAT